MSEGVESYDTDRGSPASSELTRVIEEAVEALALPIVTGSSAGASYANFVGSFGTYRDAVTDRVAEQRRVGDLVAAMMDGVHRRLDRPTVPRLTGLIR